MILRNCCRCATNAQITVHICEGINVRRANRIICFHLCHSVSLLQRKIPKSESNCEFWTWQKFCHWWNSCPKRIFPNKKLNDSWWPHRNRIRYQLIHSSTQSSMKMSWMCCHWPWIEMLCGHWSQRLYWSPVGRHRWRRNTSGIYCPNFRSAFVPNVCR